MNPDLMSGDIDVNDPSADFNENPTDEQLPVQVPCSACLTMQDVDNKFCPNCGAAVSIDPVDGTDSTGNVPGTERSAAMTDDNGQPTGDEGTPVIHAQPINHDPKQAVLRSVPFAQTECPDGHLLEGYGAVFNQKTLIDNPREGRFFEEMRNGTFAKSLKERQPVMMFDHGLHPMIGQFPIAKIKDLREDPNGLYVRAEIVDSWLTQPVRSAIASGAIDGMSVRMRIIKATTTKTGGEITRSITEAALAEIGPVGLPAYDGTSVSVRSQQIASWLEDEQTREELALLLATGTDLRSAANGIEPVTNHSDNIAHLRRRARALLATHKD